MLGSVKTIQLHPGPWVTGTRANAYYGSISVIIRHKKSWTLSLNRAIHRLQRKALRLGANSVVGVEIAIDPFSTPPTVTIVGTAAELVPLFS